MLEKMIDTIKAHEMFEKGEGIVVGVSGGPDSISLLHMLWRIKEQFDLSLYAVHLNHQFRGKEADADAEYVKAFCENLGIEAAIYCEDVTGYAKTNKMSDEEAGRELRYKFFYEIMKKKKASKIAVAQNMNDQAETVLMRLMRGAGIEGLGAIDYVRDHTIIRPLLDISRQEIEDYCEQYHLMPRIDKTNSQSVYTRNRIRLELIPYMEKHFNANIKATLCRTANLLREDNDFIEKITQDYYSQLVEKKEQKLYLNRGKLTNCHKAIQKRIIREGIKEILGNLKNIENKHIDQVVEMIHKGKVGNELDLPREIIARMSYDSLILEKKKNHTEDYDFEYPLNIGDNLRIEKLNIRIHSYRMDISQVKEIPKDKYKKYFDLDKIQKGMIVRNRRNGDKFTPFGMAGSKKLKDYFIDQKIPREQRDEIPLLCHGDEIMWIMGYRISERYKIDHNTQNVICVEYKMDKN